jgi:hypothetical protein
MYGYSCVIPKQLIFEKLFQARLYLKGPLGSLLDEVKPLSIFTNQVAV